MLLIVLFFKCSIFLDFNKLVEKVEAEKTVKIEAMKLEAVKVEAEKTIKIEAMNLEGAKMKKSTSNSRTRSGNFSGKGSGKNK